MSSESESVMANIGPNIGERRNVVIAMDGSEYAEGAFNCTVTLIKYIPHLYIVRWFECNISSNVIFDCVNAGVFDKSTNLLCMIL